MKLGLNIWRCSSCGKAAFPKRIFCSTCSGATWDNAQIVKGKIEEISLIHHMIGQENWEKRCIANASTDAGIPLTVGLIDDVKIGDEIDIYELDGAPFGRKAHSPHVN
jgi:uncharacterized OB-fold protein